MGKIGRNDPCPCGSGKKFKKCCGANETGSGPASPHDGAVPKALAWLWTKHPDDVEELVHEYFSCLDEAGQKNLSKAVRGLQQMAEINLNAWILADAEFELSGKSVRTIDLVLGPGGPLLTADQRGFLEGLRDNALGLYEVLEADPGRGLLLRDMIPRRGAPEVFVTERTASQSLGQWDILAVRVVPLEGSHVLGGEMYPFRREEGLRLRDGILEVFGEVKGRNDGFLRRTIVAEMIADAWLELIAYPRPIPEIIDSSTGERLLLVTDHYTVSDWEGLRKALEGQSDVEGDREDGWVHFEPVAKDSRRALLSINPGKADKLELFARTMGLADKGRTWFQDVAGTTVTFRTREITDPKAILNAPEPTMQPPSPKKTTISRAENTRMIHESMRRHYANWPNEAITALSGKTPRQAVRSAKGKAQVADLLKTYENSERRQAREQGRDPFDFGFLWDELKLPRPR